MNSAFNILDVENGITQSDFQVVITQVPRTGEFYATICERPGHLPPAWESSMCSTRAVALEAAETELARLPKE